MCDVEKEYNDFFKQKKLEDKKIRLFIDFNDIDLDFSLDDIHPTFEIPTIRKKVKIKKIKRFDGIIKKNKNELF